MKWGYSLTLSLFFLSLSLSLPGHAGQAEQIFVPKYFVNLSSLTQVPADILYALSVKETSTKMNNNTMSPWPFTINYANKGNRYKSYEDMIAAARNLLSQGKTAFDIGAFQVNWKWNGHRANSLEELGLPQKNGEVAAEIMREQYNRYGDWVTAAGRYHNPSNKNGLADKYAKEYREILLSIQSGRYQKSLVNKAQSAITKEGIQ